MTELLERMMTALPWGYQLAFLCRVLAATLCGALIGLERTKRLKVAGIRTHCLVAAASALFMIISKYGFADLGGGDPARVAAQVVSGISFLGLAVIYRNGNNLQGLTTAAGIWATAGVGLAIGAGMYPIGLAATLIIILMQAVMHRFNIGNDALATRDINITICDTPELRETLLEELKKLDVIVVGFHITHREDGTVNYGLTVKLSREISFEEITLFMDEHPDIINFAM